MTGAMYAAISGMKAHMQKLNVIGNNIANINTPAFKASQALFSESIYTTLTSGSNGSDSAGGVNPSQLGYGCNLGSVAMDMSTASFSADGNGMHCMIDGNGFFLTGDKPAATLTDPADPSKSTRTLAETESQNLELGRVGDFKFDSNGYLVDARGHVIYGFVTYTTDAKNIIDDAKNPKTSTQLVPIRLPIAAGSPAGAGDPAAGTALYPTLGTADGKGNQMNLYPAGSGNAIKVDNIAIDKTTGKITANNTADGSIVVVGYLALGTVANPDGVTRLENGYYQAGEGAGNCTATSIGGTVKGNLNNHADGTGATAILSSGKTALITGGLESSGTDLATEIAEMITTQRGYQANTRIITVTDSMLEEMVNMKR